MTLDEVDEMVLLDPKRWTALSEGPFAGTALQQVLEGLTFGFTIDGVTRACTHQLVRTRFAAFMQHGGRDNDWRHRGWTMPETIYRAINALDSEHHVGTACIINEEPLHEIVHEASSLDEVIRNYLQQGKNIYAALVDAGVPWQDARRLLPIGTQTYIHAVYNWISLAGFLANRLEHIMDWEINCVAQLMLREIKMKCPPVMWKHLGSHSDRAQIAKFAGLDSWPPDGKYPNPYERCETCGHARENHDADTCDGDRDLCACMAYIPQDARLRTHRPEQNPYWVLSPESMAGAPILWIATDGTYPKEMMR